MRRYQTKPFKSIAHSRRVADVRDLSGCLAQGDTPENAMGKVEVAMTTWPESAAANGDRIPEPCDRATMYAVVVAGSARETAKGRVGKFRHAPSADT